MNINLLFNNTNYNDDNNQADFIKLKKYNPRCLKNTKIHVIMNINLLQKH